MAITASMQPESGQIVYARSDFPHLIRFLSSKEGPDHIVQNQSGSDLDYLVRFWPIASGLEAVKTDSKCVLCDFARQIKKQTNKNYCSVLGNAVSD